MGLDGDTGAALVGEATGRGWGDRGESRPYTTGSFDTLCFHSSGGSGNDLRCAARAGAGVKSWKAKASSTNPRGLLAAASQGEGGFAGFSTQEVCLSSGVRVGLRPDCEDTEDMDLLGRLRDRLLPST